MEQTEELTAPKPWKHLAAIAVVAGLTAPTAAVLALNFPLQLIGLLFLVPPAFVIALFAGLHAYARAKGLPLVASLNEPDRWTVIDDRNPSVPGSAAWYAFGRDSLGR